MEKIKTNFTIILILWYCSALGQEALHNFGNLKIHDTGAVGFHHDLINNGFTDDNEGLVGFFSNENIIISGALRPIFEDIEIMVVANLFLEVGVGVTNNTNYILGNIITPRNEPDINLDYFRDSFYNGDTDATKVDGYVAITNKRKFTFPIGYEAALRPLSIESATTIASAKSAYFFENPNTPSTFIESFDTQKHDDILTIISDKEFWDVDTETLSKVRLTWNVDSEVESLVDAIENLRVVGWHTENKKWENLGITLYNGDFTKGFIRSDTFVPDTYSVLTLGGSLNKSNIDLANYLITPNNDGINDFLIIKEVALSPNNLLKIYNRWGRAVYQATNYNNLFEGKANSGIIVNKNNILPSGLYFYTIELYDIDVIHQGYLYINE